MDNSQKQIKSDYIICLDNGHAASTPGKCSPDGRFKEYAYTREIVKLLSEKLESEGYKTLIVTPEVNTDISLKERCRRINQVYKDNNKKAISISIHNNAAGADNKWHTAKGWQVYISQNASSNSKRLAQLLYTEAEKVNLKGNRSVPKEKYWVQNLAMCRDTNCPAVLTENLFQDNKEDVEFLLSEIGKETIVNIHFNAIVEYLK